MLVEIFAEDQSKSPSRIVYSQAKKTRRLLYEMSLVETEKIRRLGG
jgi:hypothetical protein